MRERQNAEPANAARPTPGAESREAMTRTPKPKATWKEQLAQAWRITKLVAVFALGGVIAWVIASLRGEAELQRLQSDYEGRLTAQRELAKPLEARARALEARRSMHLALVALEQRNFGTAERHSRDAGESLAALGVGADRYAELAERLQTFKPRISDDVSAQRAELVEFTQKFDALFDQGPPANNATR